MEIDRIPLADIRVERRLRAPSEEGIRALMESIVQAGGLRTPITVRIVDQVVEDDGSVTESVPFLVAGLHRLEAARRLGWETIDTFVLEGDERAARMWEIAENLYRAELTVQERAEHIAEWIRLAEVQSAQLAPIESRRSDGRGHRAQGGINAAVRDLGIDRTEAQRAVKIDSIAPEAKTAAREAGLDDNQSALLAVAKQATADAQVEKVREIAERRAVKPAPVILNDFETEEAWRGAMNRVWNRGSGEWRERWLADAESPVFDSV